MAESLLAASPVNSQSGAILTFAFPMLLFIVVVLVLWGLFARFRPGWVDRFQTAIAEGPGTLTPPGRRSGTAVPAPETPTAGGAADPAAPAVPAARGARAAEPVTPATGTPVTPATGMPAIPNDASADDTSADDTVADDTGSGDTGSDGPQ
jgi:hypothetical protein